MAEQQKAFNPDQAAMDAVSSIQAIMALGKLGAQKSAQIQDIIADTIRAALSHAEGEAVDHWAVRNPGLADQFRAEAQAVRKRLGFESDADDVSPNDLRERIAEIEGAPQVADTPSAKWRENGEADPHGESYNGPRSALPMGTITDDELANGVFMHGSTGGGDHSSIAWLTAAKERIRWLSRRAVAAPQVAGLTETAIKSSPAYRALHREKDHLLGLLKDQAPQVAVPEGYALVPEDMLTHFRDFHDAVKTLSKTADPDGYWEHQCEVCKRIESQLAAPTAPAGELRPDCSVCGDFGSDCDVCGAPSQQPVSDPDGLPGTPRPMSTAPRDGTMVRLLVQFTNHGVNDGFDSGPAWTIGANTYDDSGDDEWFIAGWNWQQDCFTAGEGEPLGWLPMLSAPAPDEREIAARALDDFMFDVAERVRLLSGSDQEARVLRKVNGWLHSRAKRLRAGKEGE